MRSPTPPYRSPGPPAREEGEGDGGGQGDGQAEVGGGEPCSAQTPDRPRGRDVHLVDQMPQPLLLRCAQLFVTHGGYNSIREAVGTGTPMAVAPRFGDQPANADRVQALGLGRRIPGPGAAPTAAEVAATCHRLLADPEVNARTRHAQRQMLALPPSRRPSPDSSSSRIARTPDRKAWPMCHKNVPWAPETLTIAPYTAQTPSATLTRRTPPAQTLFVRSHFRPAAAVHRRLEAAPARHGRHTTTSC